MVCGHLLVVGVDGDRSDDELGGALSCWDGNLVRRVWIGPESRNLFPGQVQDHGGQFRQCCRVGG